jgi:AcrR family transcriptional regulator
LRHKRIELIEVFGEDLKFVVDLVDTVYGLEYGSQREAYRDVVAVLFPVEVAPHRAPDIFEVCDVIAQFFSDRLHFLRLTDPDGPQSAQVRYSRAVPQLTFQRARTEDKKRQRAAALIEAARSLALESGVASVTLTDVASRAGVHYSGVRRYFTSHKEVLLHLAAEGWSRFSDTVCESLREPGPMSPARVAESLASGLAADPLFCDLLANLHIHLEHEVELERVLGFKQKSTAAVLSLTEAIDTALPGLGRSGAFDVLLAAYSLAAPLWQMANPPKNLADAYAERTDVPPDWNIDFTAALTRLITATCVGLLTKPAGSDQG